MSKGESIEHPDLVEERKRPGLDQGGVNLGTLLYQVFGVLDRADVPYCVSHGYSAYPHDIGSDVDCIVAAGWLPLQFVTLLHASAQSVGADIIQWVQDGSHTVILARRDREGRLCFLHLHLVEDCVTPTSRWWDKRVFFQGNEALAARMRRDSFWILPPRFEFGWYLARRIAKGSLDECQGRWLSDLYRQDPSGCEDQVMRCWPRSTAQLLTEASVTGRWGDVRTNISRVRSQLLRHAARRHPVAMITHVSTALRHRVQRRLSPPGLHVVLLGPDGVGKSTVQAAVQQDLAPAFFGVATTTFPPRALQRHSGSSRNLGPHSLPPRSLAISILKAGYWSFYFTFGYWLTVRRKLAQGRLVLAHRYLLDALVDPIRCRYGGPSWLVRAVWSLAAKPDLVILLDAPPDVVQSRKTEVAFSETARQRQEYRAMVVGLPYGYIVDATRPAEQVVAEVDGIILRCLGVRTARRLGLEPA